MLKDLYHRSKTFVSFIPESPVAAQPTAHRNALSFHEQIREPPASGDVEPYSDHPLSNLAGFLSVEFQRSSFRRRLQGSIPRAFAKSKNSITSSRRSPLSYFETNDCGRFSLRAT